MKYILSYFVLTFFTVGNILSNEIKLTATAPSSVIQGSRFQLVYTVNAEATNLRMPNVTDFQILMGPTTSQSTSVQIINTQVSRTVTYSFTYILRANSVGRFTIAPASIEINGRVIESNPVVIEVVASNDPNVAQADQQAGVQEAGAIAEEDLYITMTANKTNVWQDEPVIITTRIYTRVNLESISDVRQPSLPAFIVKELNETQGPIQWAVQNIDGRTYNVATFNQILIYPQSPGRHTIEPKSIEFLVRQRQARQSRSLFEDFFETTRTVRRRVNSQPLVINVRPLPSPRPANFSGIVGDVSMSITPSQTEARVNDGITIRAEISGIGNHHLARNPQLNIPVEFESFEPNVTNNITQTPQGGRGSRIVETLVIPRHPGSFVIPPVEYSYFNLSTGQYQTLRSQAITIDVEGTATPATTTQAMPASREAVQQLGRDIRFIKTNEINLRPANTFLFGSSWFIISYITALVLFAALFIIFKRRLKENSNLTLVKNRRANKMAVKKLKKASSHLKNGNQEGFYEELSRALWGYTSDKLSIPLSQLNKDNARSILAHGGVDANLSEEFLGIIETCEYARYAPNNDHQERDHLYKRAIETISNLEGRLKKVKPEKTV